MHIIDLFYFSLFTPLIKKIFARRCINAYRIIPFSVRSIPRISALVCCNCIAITKNKMLSSFRIQLYSCNFFCVCSTERARHFTGILKTKREKKKQRETVKRPITAHRSCWHLPGMTALVWIRLRMASYAWAFFTCRASFQPQWCRCGRPGGGNTTFVEANPWAQPHALRLCLKNTPILFCGLA